MQRPVSCISPAVVLSSAGSRPGSLFCTFGNRHVALAGNRPLGFSLLHQFELQPIKDDPRRWAGVSVGYHYHLLDEHGAELVRFEWHPYGNLVRFPHIHVHGQAPASPITYRMHIPSGWVSLAAVVRFAIEELGVRPLRADWDDVLAGEEQAVGDGRA